MQDTAAYQVGADFSGQLPAFAMGQSPASLEQSYRHIPGVIAASAGYRTALGPRSGDVLPVQTFAVRPASFAQTALWTKQDSMQSLSTLMERLQRYRSEGIQHDVVYALVDQAMCANFHLQPGTPFTLPTSGITHIPQSD